MNAVEAIQNLHDRCAVYTSAPTASRLLDTIGWTSDADLAEAVLLEPCVGEGAILLEAASRLLSGLRRSKRLLDLSTLAPRIVGFEFHEESANVARQAVRGLLLAAGLAPSIAQSIAHAWVQAQDFLLHPAGKARRATWPLILHMFAGASCRRS